MPFAEVDVLIDLLVEGDIKAVIGRKGDTTTLCLKSNYYHGI
jgi:hypothetical protein